MRYGEKRAKDLLETILPALDDLITIYARRDDLENRTEAIRIGRWMQSRLTEIEEDDNLAEQHHLDRCDAEAKERIRCNPRANG